MCQDQPVTHELPFKPDDPRIKILIMVGDRVQYSARFIQCTVAFMQHYALAQGTVRAIDVYGSCIVDWDEGFRCNKSVNINNLSKVTKSK